MKAKNFLTSALMMIMLLFSMAFIGCDLATASPMDNNCSIVSTDHFDPLCVNICAEQSVPANFSFSQELFSSNFIHRIENQLSQLNHGKQENKKVLKTVT